MALALVIDDDGAIRKTLRRQLVALGYGVVEGENGAQGLALCREHKPALVISDIFMPEKEGIETIREIRREFPDMKIIAISGSDAHQVSLYLEVAQNLGANAVLAKPWRAAQLKETIERLMKA